MQTNPYWPAITVDPRKLDAAWRPLFDDALARVSAEFAARFPEPEGGWPPGSTRLRGRPALFLGAPAGGAGMTTFLGTLFRKLEGKALPIYVRPFRNPLGPWKALLEAIGREMRLPDRPGAIRPWPEEPTRIQVFANDILGSLASRLVSQGLIRDSRLRSAVRFLRRHSAKVLLEGLVPEWVQWLRLNFARIVPAAEELLSELGPWASPPQNWLWAIHGLAVRTEDRVVQDACRRWAFGEPIDWAQAVRANLAVAPSEGAGERLGEDESRCRGRVEDLLRLSLFSKPFLLAFDNADAWGTEPALAMAAGRLFEELQEAPPAFVLIGAHSGRWVRSVLPHWSPRQRSRLSPLPPLREVAMPEAADLLAERSLSSAGRPARAVPEWIGAAYRDRESLPVRCLLLACALRWDEEHGLGQAAPSPAVRWFRDCRLQWEIAGLDLPYRWIAEWALLPPEPPADFLWRREETGPLGLLCARRTLPETDLLLFPQPEIPGTGIQALQAFLENAAAAAEGRSLAAFGLLPARADPSRRGASGEGRSGLPLLHVPAEPFLDLAAAVSLAIAFRREEGATPAEEEARARAEEILASWRAQLPAPAPPAAGSRRAEELTLPLLEAIRDAVRARQALPLSELQDRMPRRIGRAQALSSVAVLSEVQVRTGATPEPIFCWQPA
ncbi:protein of unknown function [Methylacidimicrobium sp. AP8]|uniref:hypothetical protein n=1 Tax=Methylacidimicrobium sp. AP8 TaxID=2730359 RepID=UPI0018C1829C|nr:hypothetical protein [Methylacidimicrobium sp. AP8]CAB4244243.1 protein of unknown function [Methylacidimicrobium sp. AP8]